MNILHKVGDQEINYECDNPLFMMKNKKNFFFISSNNNISAYNGFHIFEKEMYKIIENIKSKENKPISIINHVNSFERIYEHGFEKFSLFEEGLIYENNLNNSILEIDMRKIYDFSEEDRYYEIYSKEDYTIIKYSKYNHLFLCIKGMESYNKLENWIKKDYPYDRKRGEASYKYIFEAIDFKADKVFFSAALSEEEAISKNKILETNKLEKINFQKSIAYTNALNSLNELLTDEGLYAGLPWFFQIWTRDEAISLKGLSYDNHNKETIKKILLRQVNNILEDGKVPNRHPESILGSADGVGWVFKRINDFKTLFSQEEWNFIQKQLEISINRLEKNSINKNLIYNKAKETWMDTEANGDVRNGARIEIQALMLNMYSMFDKEKELQMKNKVREEFFKEGILFDGKDDPTIRPNIFLAYYIYPELLTKEEWKKVFDNSLDKLWLSWGGLSTIDKNSKLFCPYYTGDNNKSYHRGDSWFFINNITAIGLLKLDKKKYSKYIKKIYKSSEKDILSKGCIGDSSEISSATFLSSKGCFSQAWSLATFIELCNHY